MAVVRVRPHWINGWFLRLFGRAYLVVNDAELLVRWGHRTTVDLPDGPVEIGAGVRYLGRGPLLGYEPETLFTEATGPTTDAGDGGPPREIELRNGFFNHEPFRVVRLG